MTAFNSGNAANASSLYHGDAMLLPTLDKSILLSRPLIHFYLENLIERKGAVDLAKTLPLFGPHAFQEFWIAWDRNRDLHV